MASQSSTRNPNPSYQANPWSKFFHRYVSLLSIRSLSTCSSLRNSWISTLLKKSYKQGTLHLSDLYDLLPALESTRLTDRLEANWIDETKQTKRTPSLVRATIKSMGWRPFLIGLLLLPNVGEHGRVHRSSFLLSLRNWPKSPNRFC